MSAKRPTEKPDNDPQDETGPSGLDDRMSEGLLELPPDFKEADVGTDHPNRRESGVAKPCLNKESGDRPPDLNLV